MIILSTKQLTASDEKWVNSTVEAFEEFLPEAADCERKASSTALFFTSKYPKYDKVMEGIIGIAIQNLRNFEKLQWLIRQKELVMFREINKNLYLSSLVSLCRGSREERFMDRMIVAATSELRAAERYEQLSTQLDKTSNDLFQDLAKTKLNHANDYLKLASEYFKKEDIQNRANEILELEHEVLEFHSSHPTLF